MTELIEEWKGLEYYDFEGNRITLKEWIALMAHSYETNTFWIAKDEIGSFLISTIWIGRNHAFFGGPPLIFETMIFFINETGNPDYEHVYMQRYSKKEYALDGHMNLVNKLKAGISPKDL